MNIKKRVSEEITLLNNDKSLFNSTKIKVENIEKKEIKKKLIEKLMVWKESLKRRENSLKLIKNNLDNCYTKKKYE